MLPIWTLRTVRSCVPFASRIARSRFDEPGSMIMPLWMTVDDADPDTTMDVSFDFTFEKLPSVAVGPLK
jgi:hypothetical protein